MQAPNQTETGDGNATDPDEEIRKLLEVPVNLDNVPQVSSQAPPQEKQSSGLVRSGQGGKV